MSQAVSLSPHYPIYRELSAALHDTFHVSSSPTITPAREQERSIITKFIISALPQSQIQRISTHENPMFATLASAVLNGTQLSPSAATAQASPIPSPITATPKPSPRSATPKSSPTSSSASPFSFSVAETHGNALYITGTPGTGKTLTVTRIIDEMGLRDCDDVSILQMNAMGMGDGFSVFQALHHQLTGEQPKMKISNKKHSSKEMGDRFCSLCYDPNAFETKYPLYTFEEPSTHNFTPSQGFGEVRRPQNVIIAVIDEIDALLDKDPTALHRLFNLPYQHNCKLWLIAIANSINLADGTLAQAVRGSVTKPSVLVFQRYAREGLFDILQARVKQAAGIISKWCLKHCKKIDLNETEEEHKNATTELDVSAVKNEDDNTNSLKSRAKRSRDQTQLENNEEENEQKTRKRRTSTRAESVRTRTRRGTVDEESLKNDVVVVPDKTETPKQPEPEEGLVVTPDILNLPSIPIVISRLFQAPAIILCSRQVAAHNGDVRLLLDITRQALDAVGLLHVSSVNLYYLVCEAAKALQLEEPLPLLEDMKDKKPPSGTALITLPHILDVISKKFVPPKMKLMQNMPLQQQLVLCSAVVTQISRGHSTSCDLSYELLQKCSNMLLKSMALPEVSPEAFVVSFEALENSGFFHVKKVTNNKRFFSINVTYDDVSFALRNVEMFQTLFNKTDAKLNKTSA